MDHCPEIVIVIPTHNRKELLHRLLTDLQNQTSHPGEVIVVDSGEIPSVPLPNVSFRIRYVPNPRNNLSSSYNLGVAVSSAPMVCFLDDDVSLPDSWLERMRELINSRPEASAWGGPAIELGHRRTRTMMKGETATSRLFVRLYDVLLLSGQIHDVGVIVACGAYSLGQLDPSASYPPGYALEVDGLSNANLVVRRSVLDDIHGFDEGFGFSYQEGDLYIRIKKRGGRLVMGPKPFVYHHIAGEGSTRKLEPHSRDFEYYLQKLNASSPPIRVRLQILLFRIGYIALLMQSVTNDRRSALRGIIRGLLRGRKDFRAVRKANPSV